MGAFVKMSTSWQHLLLLLLPLFTSGLPTPTSSPSSPSTPPSPSSPMPCTSSSPKQNLSPAPSPSSQKPFSSPAPTPSPSASPFPSSPRPTPSSNDWHFVKITAKPGSDKVFIWKNKAGVEWELILTNMENDGVVVFKVGEDCPYMQLGYTQARLFVREDKIEIEGPNGIYTKKICSLATHRLGCLSERTELKLRDLMAFIQRRYAAWLHTGSAVCQREQN